MKDIRARALRFGSMVGVALVIVVGTWIAPRPASADDAAGKTIFVEQRCNTCHTIKSQSVEITEAEEGEVEEAVEGDPDPPDLSAIGSEHDKVWIAKYLIKKEEVEGRKHKKRFRGSTDELKTVAEWLATLTDAGAADEGDAAAEGSAGAE